jgi:hypothetical protein
VTRLLGATAAIAMLLSSSCARDEPTERTWTVAAREPDGGNDFTDPTTTTTAVERSTTTVRVNRGRPRSVEPPATAPAGGTSEIEAAICAVFGDACVKAIAVARCESGLRPDAVNGQHRGLMQISIYWHWTRPRELGRVSRIERLGYTPDDMLSVGPNLAVAVDIYREQGWQPWTCAS